MAIFCTQIFHREGSAVTRLRKAWQDYLPARERVKALADISRSGYVVIATKPVHLLEICQ